MKTLTVCNKCGSDKVQTLVWQRVNTGEDMGLALSESQDAQDNWCENCGDNCNFIDIQIEDVNKKLFLLL